MKKQGLLLLLLAAALAGYLTLYKRPLTGHISAFQYRSGHAWYGHQILGIAEEAGESYAYSSWEPGMMEGVYHEGPRDGRVPLTREQREAFDDLCLKTLRLPEWKEYYEPRDMITDQDSWSITYTWDGETRKTGGYYIYPDGLSEIGDFFGELFPTDSHTTPLPEAVIKKAE